MRKNAEKFFGFVEKPAERFLEILVEIERATWIFTILWTAVIAGSPIKTGIFSNPKSVEIPSVPGRKNQDKSG